MNVRDVPVDGLPLTQTQDLQNQKIDTHHSINEYRKTDHTVDQIKKAIYGRSYCIHTKVLHHSQDVLQRGCSLREYNPSF